MPETLEKPVGGGGLKPSLTSRACSSETRRENLRCTVFGGVRFQSLPRNRNSRSEILECEHVFEAWYCQAKVLQREIDATVSPSLKGLLNADLEQILTTRQTF
jgi:hypothetical protein